MRTRLGSLLGQLICSLLALLLASCGSHHSSRLELRVSAGVKTLTVSWGAVPSAASYRIYEDPDGSGFAELARDLTTTEYTVDVSVHRFPWSTARFRVDACNAKGCTASAPVLVADRMLDAIGYFKASNTGKWDLFGYSVALSADGSTLAVGAIYESSNATGVGGDQSNDSSTHAGAVYVFARSGSSWAQQAYVKAPTKYSQGQFGYAVALSADGDTLAVGAPDRYGAAYHSGEALVFTRTGSSWSYQAALEPSAAYEAFGSSVALSADGDTLAVGAPVWSDADGAGTTYVFRRDGEQNWSQETTFEPSDPKRADEFGASVALSADGDLLAVGEPGAGHDKGSTTYRAGAVHLFTHGEAGWAPAGDLTASNAGPGDGFGGRLALSGDGLTLAVGAPLEASMAAGVGGGEAAQADDSATCAGAVYVFTLGGTGWSQQTYVKPSHTWSYEYFGTALSLSADGSALAVGAWGEPADARGIGGDETIATGATGKGAVYLFTRSDDSWSQQAYVKASNTDASSTEAPDEFGRSVAMSSDGRTLAAGAYGESSAATGIDGAQDDNSRSESGAVYLY